MKFKPKLNLAAGVGGVDDSEGCALEEAGPAQDRSVGNVDELAQEFDVDSLGQRKTFCYVQVGGCQARSAERANAAGSKVMRKRRKHSTWNCVIDE